MSQLSNEPGLPASLDHAKTGGRSYVQAISDPAGQPSFRSEVPSLAPRIILGPLLRRGNDAPASVSVWVEMSAPCTVAVTTVGSGERPSVTSSGETFHVLGHHYALVEVTIPPGAGGAIEYQVEAAGTVLWPDESLGVPASGFLPWDGVAPFRISGGSCRQQAPQNLEEHSRLDAMKGRFRFRSGSSDDPDQTVEDESSDGDPVTKELGTDALAALAAEVQRGARALPHLLVLSGDQVYADEQHESVQDFMHERRGGPPAEDYPEVTSFEEYTWLYQRTWEHPLIRWILSCVPTVMIFDDHDLIDDWNISDTWMRDIAKEPWWQDRLEAGLMSYWVYQHLGNLSAEQRLANPLFNAVVQAEDGGGSLRAFARTVGTGSDERLDHSWSFELNAGPVHVVVLDARNGRVVDPDARSMLSPADWGFFDNAVTEGNDLLIVSSVPWILPHGVHNLERWCSTYVRDARYSWQRRLGEKIRREVDLEHWAAFGDSYEQLRCRLAARCADNPNLRPVVFSGDVHFAYVAEQPLGEGARAVQVVSSPLRQGDKTYEQFARQLAMTKGFSHLMRRWRARVAGMDDPPNFTIEQGVWTTNNIASFEYKDGGASARLDGALLAEDGLKLEPLAIVEI